MPEKFRRLYKIGFIIFFTLSLIELAAFLISFLLGFYLIAEGLISELIITIIFSLILLLTKKQWQGEMASPKWFSCPKCDEEKPLVRIPKNLKQMATGGWTCAKCGTEVIPGDKKYNLVWLSVSASMLLIGIILFLVLQFLL